MRYEESMSKEMVISANPHETRVAILEEGQLCEYYVEREKEFALVGSIYKGRVTRVLPGMQSAFVDIGLDSDAFLYVSDFLEEVEEVEQIVTTVEDKVQKMEEQGGEVFASAETSAPTIEPNDVDSTPAPRLEPGPAEAAHVLESPVDAAEHPGMAAEAGQGTQPEPPAVPPVFSPSNHPPVSREPFERGRRDRRDFGRRGGRRGPHRGRVGDRRYGRELPQSKYASPRSYDEPSPSNYTPVILPGESLAKYRDRVPPTAPVFTEEPSTTVPAAQPDNHADSDVERAEIHVAPSSGLEPLPGETLSKYQPNEPCAAVSPIIPSEPFVSAVQARGEKEHEAESLEGPAAEAGEHESASDGSESLSEDQAATLAAHVTEAQIEEAQAAREREEHEQHEDRETESFGASESAGEPEISEPGELSSDESAIEEEELEEEESEAEAEGMIAPPAQTFGGEPHLENGETEPAAAGEPIALDEPPLPQEQQPWKARVRDDFRSRMQHPSRRGGRDRGRRREDRGRRPHHGYGHHPRPQPRRPQLIADLLKQGQEIIVQIAKEPLGKKGARITSHVALPGRFLVYMPTLDHTGVSRKIASAEERARLRHLVNEAKGSATGGFIVRTAAASATPEEVRADVDFLTRTWSDIKSRAEQRKAPALLHRDLNLVERILRDYVTTDYAAIWVDSEEEFAKVVEFMGRFQPELVNRVKLYTKDTPVFEEFGIQQEIDKGLRPKVWLKSGGYIVINHTEALVAIDVNTGKFVGKGSTRLEDTIVRTNLEAVKEIVRQMRLRDLGGIIIIDFIDMEERRNREKVMAALEDALRADRAPSKVLRFNEFGLVAITRKRTKQALERTLCQPCPYCTGSGMVKSVPTLCYEIQTEARKMAPEMDSGSITLRVHPEISKALKTRESSLIEELERWTKKSVIIQADPTLHWEQYDIY
jgi:Rne/Rng family ribonuclease